jgi:signal recognition particle subunit SRP54
MSDMMKTMGKRGGLRQRMMGGSGGPSQAEMERMQSELATLDPRALENLPKELRDQLPKGLPSGLPAGPAPRLPGLPGFGGAPKFPGLPGLPGRKK